LLINAFRTLHIVSPLKYGKLASNSADHYDMCFEVAILRLGRSWEKPLD